MRQTRIAVLIILIFLLFVPRLALAQGEPLGPEFRVNTVTGGQQIVPWVASGGGDFIVVWRTSAPYGIAGQRFDGGGNPLGTEFRVNSFEGPGGADVPQVAANGPGLSSWSGSTMSWSFRSRPSIATAFSAGVTPRRAVRSARSLVS